MRLCLKLALFDTILQTNIHVSQSNHDMSMSTTSQLFKLLEAGLGCDVGDSCAENTEQQSQAEKQTQFTDGPIKVV